MGSSRRGVDGVTTSKQFIGVGPATLTMGLTLEIPREMQSLIWEVSHVYVPSLERGKGWGTKLMRQACDRADSANVGLLLHVSEDNQDRLVSWYEGFGFVTIQEEPKLMFRPQRSYRNLH